jgi:hypothetical protein
MPQAPEKVKECLIQGLKKYFTDIVTAQDGIIALKAAVIGIEPDIDSILTTAQQAALNTLITDQSAICDGTVYSVIENKTSHLSHDWRRILGL